LSVKVYFGATLPDLSSKVLTLVDGMSLTGYNFNKSHPVVFLDGNKYHCISI